MTNGGSSEAGRQPPSRQAVERRWRGLIDGAVTREETHAWAKPWVGERWEGVEGMVESGLQTLHGFDLNHHPDTPNLLRHASCDVGRRWVHSDQHIANELSRWLSDVEAFDPNPAAFRARARAKALAALTEEVETMRRRAMRTEMGGISGERTSI